MTRTAARNLNAARNAVTKVAREEKPAREA
jgi:hypothetical protein